jgi:hypothetical protein
MHLMLEVLPSLKGQMHVCKPDPISSFFATFPFLLFYRLNGRAERSHRIDEEEFYRLLDGVVIDDTNLFNERVRKWETFYNYCRPHAGLNGQTPYDRFREKVGLCV